MKQKFMIGKLFLFFTVAAWLNVMNLFSQSGNCSAEGEGNDVTWKLDCSMGTLTISGRGKMEDYWITIAPPWEAYRSFVNTVVIDEGVTTIGDYAFYYYSDLAVVTIPNSVASIGSWTFHGCSGLTTFTVASNNPNYCSDNGVLFNKNKTYLIQCPAKTPGTYTIPNSVTSIAFYAFSGCSVLTSILIPKSVASIGVSAFSGCSSLSLINVDAENQHYGSVDGILYDIHDEYGKAQISIVQVPNAILGSVTIPNMVTRIPDYAFSSRSGLTSVIIPESVTDIGRYAFYDCNVLTSVIIPHSVTFIGDYAFSGCSVLASVTIPNLVTYINQYVFSDCCGLTSITIPNSVTGISSDAFLGCTDLTKLVIEDGDTPIAFNYNSGNAPLYPNDIFIDCPLDTLYLGRSLTYNNYSKGNDRSPFFNKQTIKKLTISNSVIVGEDDFLLCGGFKDVTTPTVLQSFISPSLERLTITSACTSLNSGCLKSATTLQELSLPFIGTSPTTPTTLNTLGVSKTTLKKLSISRCVSNIQIANNALSGYASLEELTLASSVQGLGENALYGCSGLTKIYSHWAYPPSAYNSSTFQGVNKFACTVCVPVKSRRYYSVADGWKEFYNIVEGAPLITALAVPRYGGEIPSSGTDIDNVTLTAIANTGYAFAGWVENNNSLGYFNPLNITSTSPRTVYAIFTPIENADENIAIQTRECSASISWTAVMDAMNYILAIYSDENRTDTIAIFQLDAKGKIQPSAAMRSPQQNLSCDISDLITETQYYYSLTSYDAGNHALTIAIGDFTTQVGTGVNDVGTPSLRIYPNPVKDVLHIDILFSEKTGYLTITNLSGHMVESYNCESLQTAIIDVAHLPKGLYVVRFGECRKKFIKL